MKITTEQYKELQSLIQPLQVWMSKNCHPHTKVLMDSENAELLEEISSVQRAKNTRRPKKF